MMEAMEVVSAERQRQIDVKGWTRDSDDKHRTGGELVLAAAAYAIAGAPDDIPYELHRMNLIAKLWPWGLSSFQPTSHRRSLVKSAALLVAEIERIDRASPDRLLKEQVQKPVQEDGLIRVQALLLTLDTPVAEINAAIKKAIDVAEQRGAARGLHALRTLQDQVDVAVGDLT